MTDTGGSPESVARNQPELLNILQEMKEQVDSVNDHVTALKEHAEREEFDTDKGVSLLELKYHQILSYLVNLTQLILAKSRGQPIRESLPLHRLIETRTVLEKLRPLDQRLRYQVDKLIRVATTGATGALNDPLRFRANPSSLVSKLGEEKGEEGASSDEERQPRAYIPPRVVAMPYEEDEGGKRMRRAEREKRRALQSSLVKDLQEEFLDTPVELTDTVPGVRRRRELEKEKRQERFEEEHFLRLSHKRSRDSGRGARETAEELTDFSGFRGLTRGEGDEGLPAGKRKRTSKKSRQWKGRKVQ